MAATVTVDKDGWFANDASIRREPRPTIEHGAMKSVRGIIVHQTGSSTAAGTLSSYKNAGANGAHFLIDKDGTTYQVASMYRKTWHVGKLQAKCLATHNCSPTEVKAIAKNKYTEINKLEMAKSVPLRFPSNNDAIGIELVGLCVLDPKYLAQVNPNLNAVDKAKKIDQLTAQYGVFETVTAAQNRALDQLISKIQIGLGMADEDKDQIFEHPQASRKNSTEASTAQWPGKQ
jgi:hypothetical protein